ncbi:MAG TPA: DUF4382 domain-containing protein [Gemmatimonadales bacterium]|nr:DUF4382 domain-containing protein [Gemmatimonadales bacterium]
MLRLLAPMVLVGALACSDDGTSGTGTVVVRLTDAPADDFASAVVYISEVTVKGSGASANEIVISDTPQSYDLLTLQNGVTATLGTATVPTGTYSQIRLLVDSARVTLKSGNTFADGTTSAKLTVPSGSQTGIKVTFSPPVTVTEDQTVLVVDFDINQSFIFQGPRNNPTSISFRPVLHATALDVAGSISGIILPVTAQATVYAIAGTDTVQTTFANVTTGAYTLQFLPPGTYVVGASATGFQSATSASLTLSNAQALTGINLTLLP